MTFREPPDNAHLYARNTDPETSHDAGASASNRLSDAQAAAWVLMVVGHQPMNDEEIFAAIKSIGYPGEISRMRHGRKYAADLGMIVQLGKRPMASGKGGRAWVKA